MIRRLEKKNWRKNVEECWNVSDQLTKCVANSQIYKGSDKQVKSIISDSIGKSFMNSYLNNWVNGDGYNENQKIFYNPESNFWQINGLTQLKEECQLNSLMECCQEKYNLENLNGDYEWIGGSIEK